MAIRSCKICETVLVYETSFEYEGGYYCKGCMCLQRTLVLNDELRAFQKEMQKNHCRVMSTLQKLATQIKALETEVKYRPGGTATQELKQHFDTLAQQQ